MTRFHWEITTTCPQCGGTVFADGETDDDPQDCTVEDTRALCYGCGASFTVNYATGAKALAAQATDSEAQ